MDEAIGPAPAGASNVGLDEITRWLAATGVPLAVLDRTGTVSWASDALAMLLGRDAGRCIGEPAVQILHGLDIGSPTADGTPCSRPPQPVSWLTPDGRTHRAVARLQPAPGPGHGGCRLLILGDIEAPAARPEAANATVPTPHITDTYVQLAMATQLVGMGTWRHDLALNRVFYDDRSFQILGREPRPDGMPIDEVRSWIHPDDIALVLASAQRTLQSGMPSDVDARYRHADGSWRHVLTRRVLQRDASGAPVAFLGVVLDTTSEVERLRRSSELSRRLAAAARAARMGIWTTTVDPDDTDWNDQMYELFDRDPARGPPALDEWVRECIHPDDRHRVRERARAYLVSGDEPTEIELRAQRRDGSVRWLVMRADVDRASSHRRRLIGVALDVTEQHSALAAVRDAAERTALINRSVGIGVWEQDLLTGAAQWDEAMFRLRGLEPGPVAPDGDQRLAMVHPDDRERMRERNRQIMGSGQMATSDFRVVWPGGEVRWLASRSTPVLDDHGREVRRIGLNWDITDARLAEVAQRERLVALRESQAKSRFLARMSHELRTPLNAVLGFTQLLLHDGERTEPGQRRRRLDHIRAAGEHLLSLINDVLDLSRVEGDEMRLDMGAVALDPLVHGTLPLLETAARSAGVSMVCGPLDALPRADATRLRQVLLNLLSNGIKYNRPGGWVRVEAHTDDGDGDADPDDGHDVVSDRGADLGGRRRVRIRVSDSGRGMTSEQLRHVFEPFNRLGIEREGIEGTGIGLAIVKALVERMGGRIGVTSRPQAGSVFEVTLPEADVTEPHTSPAPLDGPLAALPAAPHPRRAQLLYIEDNPVNVLIVEELVARRTNLTLAVAPDGLSGVARALQLRPELILIDMQLPDIDGYEVLRRLRTDPVTALIPCIALSANAMPQDIERAIECGFADYWTKPLDFKGFLASLDALFGREVAG